MSNDAINWAYEHKTDCGPCKSLLACLANRANAAGVAWPKVRRLANETGWKKRTVFKHLRHLRDDGTITITPQFGPKGQKESLYKLNMPPTARRAGGPGASCAAAAGTSFMPPVNEVQTIKEEPSLEPSLNLPIGVAPAFEEGARRLAETIGLAQFNFWYGDGRWEDGLPMTFHAGSLAKANYIREKHGSKLERAFGREVAVRPPLD